MTWYCLANEDTTSVSAGVLISLFFAIWMRDAILIVTFMAIFHNFDCFLLLLVEIENICILEFRLPSLFLETVAAAVPALDHGVPVELLLPGEQHEDEAPQRLELQPHLGGLDPLLLHRVRLLLARKLDPGKNVASILNLLVK